MRLQKHDGKDIKQINATEAASVLVVRVIQAGKKGSKHFDAVPKVLEAQVFVRGVLIVIVVGDGEGDHGHVAALLKKIYRQASTCSW